jgi:hypothetical protein
MAEKPLDSELRATSDRMLDVIDRLRDIESKKRAVPIGSADFLRLAEEAEGLARTTFRWGQLQEQLARQAVAIGPSKRSIEQTPRRRLSTVLAEWREAEFRLQLARPGSPEAARAVSELERLREEYRLASQEKAE